jgi:hypothetical protein
LIFEQPGMARLSRRFGSGYLEAHEELAGCALAIAHVDAAAIIVISVIATNTADGGICAAY